MNKDLLLGYDSMQRQKAELPTSNDRLLSQNPKLNASIFETLSQGIMQNTVLKNFQLFNICLSEDTWRKLGKALGINDSVQTLSIHASNLSSKNMRELMKGVALNNSI